MGGKKTIFAENFSFLEYLAPEGKYEYTNFNDFDKVLQFLGGKKRDDSTR